MKKADSKELEGMRPEYDFSKKTRQVAITGRITMKNIEMKLEGNILTMKVDLTKEFGPSSSGKTIIIASSEGNVAVDGHEAVKVGLNVYKKR